MTNNNDFEIGDVSFDGPKGTYEKIPKFRFSDDTNKLFVRLMGPINSKLREKNGWVQRMCTHWGYRINYVDRNGNAGERFMPFECVEQSKYVPGPNGAKGTFQVTQTCPQCDKVNAEREMADTLRARLKTQGKSAEEIERACAPSEKYCKDHKVTRKFLMIAKSGGVWGYLEVNLGTYKAIEKLAKETKNLFSRTAPIVELTRVKGPTASQNTFFATLVQEDVEIGGRTYKEVKTDTLTESDIQQLKKLDLGSQGTRYTREQVQAIVTSLGNPEVFEAIRAAGQPVTTETFDPEQSPTPAEVLRASATKSVQTTAAESESVMDELTRLRNQIALMSSAPPSQTASSTEVLNGPDKFLSKYGQK